MKTEVLKIAGQAELAEQIAPAVKALRAGKLVAFPTETVYGLGVLATDAQAMDRLRELKQRPESPFTVHLASPAQAEHFVQNIPPAARALMAKAWPGPVTLLLHTGGRFTHPSLASKSLYHRLVQGDVVGLRCPDDAVCRLLLERVGKPVVASSANLAGQRPPTSAADVLEQLDGKIDLLIDAGPTRYRKSSTIVSFDGPRLKVVREGVYDAGAINRMARRTILFVCTGNTCRSPMAAALARKLLAQREGVASEQLEQIGLEVLSAGAYAVDGSPASDEAAEAVAELGGSLENHRSRKLNNELLTAADVIFCMTAGHAALIAQRDARSAGKTHLLDAAGDIEDPIGQDVQAYLRVARRIERGLRRWMKEKVL